MNGSSLSRCHTIHPTDALHIDESTKGKYTYEIWTIQNRWSGKHTNATMRENQSDSDIVVAEEWIRDGRRDGDGTENLIGKPNYEVRLEIFFFDSQLRPSENWENRSFKKISGDGRERKRDDAKWAREGGKITELFYEAPPVGFVAQSKIKIQTIFPKIKINK